MQAVSDTVKVLGEKAVQRAESRLQLAVSIGRNRPAPRRRSAATGDQLPKMKKPGGDWALHHHRFSGVSLFAHGQIIFDMFLEEIQPRWMDVEARNLLK